MHARPVISRRRGEHRCLLVVVAGRVIDMSGGSPVAKRALQVLKVRDKSDSIRPGSSGALNSRTAAQSSRGFSPKWSTETVGADLAFILFIRA